MYTKTGGDFTNLNQIDSKKDDRELMIKKLENFSKSIKYTGLKKVENKIYLSITRRKKILEFIILICSSIILIILLCICLFKISLIITSFSDILSLVAFGFSIFSILFYFIAFMDYPYNDLKFKRLDNDTFELKFLMQNLGHGRLKLKLAFYLIEEKELAATNEDFIQSKGKSNAEYLNSILVDLQKADSTSKIYSLGIIERKESRVFFTYNDKHIETRIHKFKKLKLYRITFFVLTYKNISYYRSKHLINWERSLPK